MRRKTDWQKSPLRIGVFIAFTGLVVIALIARLAQVQIIHGEEYRNAAQANQIRLIPVSAPRGTIFDRHGHVLVRNRPSFVVGLIPSEVKDITSEMKALSQSIGVPPAQLWKRLLHHRGINYTDFDEVATYEPYGPVILASDLSVAHVARVAELQSDLPGVDLEAQPVRDYPMQLAGSHVFGYVGQITEDEYKGLRSQGYSPNDVLGKDGLEYQYDTYLRGKPGGQRIVVDAQGQVVPSIKLPPKAPVSGDSVVLNLDWRLQAIAERALSDEIKTWGHGRTYGGAVVIEDPWSGAILALVSDPNFNPNDFATGISDKKFSYYLNSPQEPLYNRAIAAATPTGSTFKMVTGSGAITAGVVGVKETVYDSGGWNCGGAEFRDLASGGLGSTTFVPALAASSDGYFYQLSWRLGNPRLRHYALEFGLSEKSGIDLPGEFAGNWPTNASMLKTTGLPLEPSDVCSLGIGQGAMQATPLQMADVVSAVVNGGTLYKPQVVRMIRDPHGNVVKTFGPQIIRHVPVTAQALKAVRDGMADVTSAGGTGYGLAIDGLPYGGKTGTAQTAGGSGPNTTWFVAFAPVKRTKLAIAVFVDRSGGYGAQVAGPIARRILVEYFHKKP
ncbi:MAG: penicillin-binding protein 2 [Candidatus Baltobacteraceae bacterium]